MPHCLLADLSHASQGVIRAHEEVLRAAQSQAEQLSGEVSRSSAADSAAPFGQSTSAAASAGVASSGPPTDASTAGTLHTTPGTASTASPVRATAARRINVLGQVTVARLREDPSLVLNGFRELARPSDRSKRRATVWGRLGKSCEVALCNLRGRHARAGVDSPDSGPPSRCSATGVLWVTPPVGKAARPVVWVREYGVSVLLHPVEEGAEAAAADGAPSRLSSLDEYVSDAIQRLKAVRVPHDGRNPVVAQLLADTTQFGSPLAAMFDACKPLSACEILSLIPSACRTHVSVQRGGLSPFVC